MKFGLICNLKRDGKSYIAECGDLILYNVLLSDESLADGFIRLHDFIVVVNKRGQLTVLCTK